MRRVVDVIIAQVSLNYVYAVPGRSLPPLTLEKVLVNDLMHIVTRSFVPPYGKLIA